MLPVSTPPKAFNTGWMRLAVTAATSAVKAAPTTTATARSMTLPRRMKSRKPLIMMASPQVTSDDGVTQVPLPTPGDGTAPTLPARLSPSGEPQGDRPSGRGGNDLIRGPHRDRKHHRAVGAAPVGL